MSVLLRIAGLIVVWLALLTGPLSAQPITLSPDQAHDDLLYLRRQLRTYHPGLGHYTPNAQMEQLFDSLYNRVNSPIEYLSFYHHLSPYLNGLKDGHTNLNHRRGFIDRDTRFVPFYVRQVDHDYFISHNASADTSLRRGTRLLSVQGQAIAEVHRTLMDGDRSGSDGDNLTGRHHWSLMQFADYYAAWYGSVDSVTIEYQLARLDGSLDSTIRTKRVAGIVSATFRQTLIDRYKADFGRNSEFRQPNLSLRLVDSLSNTAVLRVSSFTSSKSFDPFQWSFKRRLKKAFREIKATGVENLVVDLQDNGGGAVINSARLLQFWMRKPFTIMQSEYIKPAARNELVNRWNPLSCLDFNLRYRRDGQGGFASRATVSRHYRPYKRLAFKGNLYLLMNGSSFSAATSVLAKTLDAGQGTFVGEACGGAYWGDFAGQFKYVTLPHSRIQVRIPLKKLTHAVAEAHANGFTIEPDFLAQRTHEDLMTNRNVALRQTLLLIRRQVTAIRAVGQDGKL
ncbi:S41 family peptidase [Fibrivirga algicola]|uniref:Peptidase S41 n=1 Tax=Fibrivirga algicola TaxID=2950420 RepID=A0ABX0QGQ0_9BACT|nr:S41 family peptidase [Fibrivirga algicola]ARK09988.1 peptidase S41 [Fibrella sp. ES10-3-2-2]NID11574.1 peptidase S41 [Fibrivirga algicola]